MGWKHSADAEQPCAQRLQTTATHSPSTGPPAAARQVPSTVHSLPQDLPHCRAALTLRLALQRKALGLSGLHRLLHQLCAVIFPLVLRLGSQLLQAFWFGWEWCLDCVTNQTSLTVRLQERQSLAQSATLCIPLNSPCRKSPCRKSPCRKAACVAPPTGWLPTGTPTHHHVLPVNLRGRQPQLHACLLLALHGRDRAAGCDGQRATRAK